jgi:hypothetical protein
MRPLFVGPVGLYHIDVNPGRYHRVGKQGLLVHNMSAPSSLVPNPGSSATRFEALDWSDKRFFIAGKVQTGVLEYVIVTKDLATKEISTMPAADFFSAMMAHFANEGTTIHTISDEWSDADPDLTTQLERFNKDLLAGRTEQQAAENSFTGRMSNPLGFTTISFSTLLPPGARGQYREVRVNFKK